jgi:hypothetical protein
VICFLENRNLCFFPSYLPWNTCKQCCHIQRSRGDSADKISGHSIHYISAASQSF